MHVFHAILFILKLQSVLIWWNGKVNDMTKTQGMSKFDESVMCGIFTENARTNDLVENVRHDYLTKWQGMTIWRIMQGMWWFYKIIRCGDLMKLLVVVFCWICKVQRFDEMAIWLKRKMQQYDADRLQFRNGVAVSPFVQRTKFFR